MREWKEGEKPRPESVGQAIKIFLCGLLMGAADIVPGVSGGTIAFITGIYEEFIASIKTFNSKAIKLLISLDFRGFFSHIAWEYLITLFGGVGVALLSLAQIIHWLLGHELYHAYIFSAFFGLIFASIILCARRVQTWQFQQVTTLLLGIFVAYLGTQGADSDPSKDNLYDVPIAAEAIGIDQEAKIDNYDSRTERLIAVEPRAVAVLQAKGMIGTDTIVYHHLTGSEVKAGTFAKTNTWNDLWWPIFCGAIGSSAMLLPGISGSYLLLILGMYPMVIAALADVSGALHGGLLPWDSIFLLSSVGTGIVIGIALCSRFVYWLLMKFHGTAIAFLTGLMIGASHILWPFWTTVYAINPLKLDKGPQLKMLTRTLPNWSNNETLLVLGLGLGAFTLVLLMEFIQHIRSRSS